MGYTIIRIVHYLQYKKRLHIETRLFCVFQRSQKLQMFSNNAGMVFYVVATTIYIQKIRSVL